MADKDSSRKPPIKDALIRIGEAVELFHSPDGTGYATYRDQDGNSVTTPLQSALFERYLRWKLFSDRKQAATKNALDEAIQTLESIAQFDRPELPVSVRVAGDMENIFLDLGTGRVAHVSSDGWEVVKESPSKLVSFRGMRSLPDPETSGSLEDLRPLLNLRDDTDWVLLKGFLVMALHPVGPYPILEVMGEHGTGKSFVLKLIRALIDPNDAPTRGAPKNAHDLAVSATSNWLLAFENLSGISDWFSDELCRLVTGSGFATRELYTTRGEAIFQSTRPCLIDGIGEQAVRGDLVDRIVRLELPPIREGSYRTKGELDREMSLLHPRVLGALLDAVACALRHIESTELASHPRLADFARWVEAAGPALGLEPGEFLSAYESNIADAKKAVVESHPIVQAILGFLEHRKSTWRGTATELLGLLEDYRPYPHDRSKPWPSASNVLGWRLRRLAPGLRSIGIEVGFLPRTPGGKQRLLELRLVEDPVADSNPPRTKRKVRRPKRLRKRVDR